MFQKNEIRCTQREIREKSRKMHQMLREKYVKITHLPRQKQQKLDQQYSAPVPRKNEKYSKIAKNTWTTLDISKNQKSKYIVKYAKYMEYEICEIAKNP